MYSIYILRYSFLPLYIFTSIHFYSKFKNYLVKALYFILTWNWANNVFKLRMVKKWTKGNHIISSFSKSNTHFFLRTSHLYFHICFCCAGQGVKTNEWYYVSDGEIISITVLTRVRNRWNLAYFTWNIVILKWKYQAS